MTSSSKNDGMEHLLKPDETAEYLRLSLAWLAKARMSGDGPPFVKIGRSVRYSKAALLHWAKTRQRLSTNEQ